MWSVDFTKVGKKSLASLDKKTQNKIKDYIDNKLLKSTDPKKHGKMLSGDKKGFWSFRVGSYRVIGEIKNDQLIILIVKIAHRKEVYR